MRLTACVLLTLLACVPASAQAWKEYAYENDGFAAQYPTRPKIEEASYRTAQIPAGQVKERIYAVASGGVIYRVGVADFRDTDADQDKTIDEAANAMMARGKLTHDERGRLDWHFGREIRVEDVDGTSYTNAIFFINKKLYQIEVVFPKTNSDPVGSSGIHFFQQAFRLLPAY
jgi:hypothetical protein